MATDHRQDRFAAGAERLAGATLLEATAHGKHLFMAWDHGEVLHVHLGLFGKFTRHVSAARVPSDNLRLSISAPGATWDLTGPTVCELGEPGLVDQVRRRLGPDPLRPDSDPGRFASRVGRSDRPIGDLLLDQAVIAGVGNVYRAEILHLTGVHPLRAGRDLAADEVTAIWTTTVQQLSKGVERNRIVTVPLDGRRADRIARSDAVHVYKQERCRSCAGAVTAATVAARNMFWCEACQPRRRSRRRQSRSTT